MQITFLGTGDAFGSGGRFNTCLHFRHADGVALIDCGASSMVAMQRAEIDRAEIDAIILSHLHGDHFGALPFFMLDAQFVARRSKPLVVAGPPGTRERVHQAMEVFFPGSTNIGWHFEFIVEEVAPRSPCDICGVNVEGYEVDHPSGALSYALRLGVEGKIVTYSGDTQWTDALVDASRDADLFICECHGFEHSVPYHLNHAELCAKRDKFSAKRMILTHMSDDMLDNLDSAAFETAHDGLRLDL